MDDRLAADSDVEALFSAEEACQGLDIASSVQHWYGVVVAQRVLGRLAQARGALAEAATHFQEVFQLCVSIQARYEQARTLLDLATLAHTQGNRAVAATHLDEAHALFKVLQILRWVEHTTQLARESGILLSAESP